MHIPDGAEVLRVKVFPEASEDLVVKKWMEGKTGQYEVYTRAPALENQANREVLYLLARHLGVEQKRLRIISGHQSLSKLILRNP
jgi:uncharacterized protein YggU (UPF0235/DUF167 family)